MKTKYMNIYTITKLVIRDDFQLYVPALKPRKMGWRDGAAVSGPCCSCKTPSLGLTGQIQGSQPSQALASRDVIPFALLKHP